MFIRILPPNRCAFSSCISMSSAFTQWIIFQIKNNLYLGVLGLYMCAHTHTFHYLIIFFFFVIHIPKCVCRQTYSAIECAWIFETWYLTIEEVLPFYQLIYICIDVWFTKLLMFAHLTINRELISVTAHVSTFLKFTKD